MYLLFLTKGNPNSAVELFPFYESELLQHYSMSFQELLINLIVNLFFFNSMHENIWYVLLSAWNLALESADSTLNMQDLFLLCYKVLISLNQLISGNVFFFP